MDEEVMTLNLAFSKLMNCVNMAAEVEKLTNNALVKLMPNQVGIEAKPRPIGDGILAGLFVAIDALEDKLNQIGSNADKINKIIG
jgi:hypothetical protein